MRSIVSILFLCTVVFLAGCGKSLTDAEKATAVRAVASMSSLGTTGSRQMKQAVARIASDQRSGRTCTAGTSTPTSGITFTTVCPASGATVVAISATGPINRTCAGETFSAQDINATVSYLQTNTVINIDSVITATINSKALACAFSASVDFSTTTVTTVSDTGYRCTYDGANIEKADLEKANCAL